MLKPWIQLDAHNLSNTVMWGRHALNIQKQDNKKCETTGSVPFDAKNEKEKRV